MYNVGVIGDRDSVLCFQSVGFDVRPVIDKKQAVAELNSLSKNGCAVIFVTDEYYKSAETEIAAFSTSYTTAVIPIPGKNSRDDIGMKKIKQAIEKAVGTDIVG